MIRVLFICHGNICRSPIAKYILQDRVNKSGLSSRFHIDSAATSREEISNPVYPPMARLLQQHGISCADHAARQIRPEEYQEFDLILVMDRRNQINAERIFGPDTQGKIHLLSDFADFSGEVEDPWYTGNFQKVYEEIEEGCSGILKFYGFQ